MTDQSNPASRFVEDYMSDHPEVLEVYVQGPNGKDLFRPGSVEGKLTSTEYGPLDVAYVVRTQNRIRVYARASSVSGEYGKFDVKFDTGVLQVFGFNGNLIEAYAPGAWTGVSGSDAN
jgi:hypothetical protein